MALKIWGRKYLEYKTWMDVLISVNVAGKYQEYKTWRDVVISVNVASRWRGCSLSNAVSRTGYRSCILQK
jgi:hypothetical protein